MDMMPVVPMPHDTISIRPVTDVTGTTQFQELERLVWNTDDVDVVPNHVLVTLIKNGGLLLAAYAPDGPEHTGGMIGAAFGWLGIGVDPADPAGKPRLKFASHMAGVLPAWQGKHIGLRLKLAQREAVLAQGLTDWMTWTFDPLFRPNAVFNIHRLGATCRTYLRNVYGELNDDLNRGVPSDRFQVDWRLSSPHVLHDLAQPTPQRAWDPDILALLPAPRNAAGYQTPPAALLPEDGRPLAVPIPDDISTMRRADRDLSLAWRMAMRAVMEAAFGAGYTVVDCIHLPAHGWHYILVREYL